MRHDPASAAVEVMLRSLKMYGMAQAVGELIEQGAPAFDAAVPILSQLLKAEMAEREVRSIAYQIKAARFPAYKDLAGFDFASSEVNEALVRQLHRGDFIDGADNVVLIGGPGTGKTHRLISLVRLLARQVARDYIAAMERETEVTEVLRSLVSQIILTPENGEIQIDVRGNLAGILGISLKRKKPAGEAGNSQVAVVAGVGFEPTTFRL